jgi:acyl-coenzyme A synthetase/AMP-(fatty) acid ligase
MVVEVLSSGTTGAPKNIPLEISALARGVQIITVAGDNVERQVEFMFAPLTSIGGILSLLAYPLVGARFCMFERFKVDTWVDAVKRHRPKSVGSTPTIIRSLLQAQVPPESLESVEIVYGGGGPLDMDTRKRFAETFNVDLCWGYGATEFAGTLAGWTPQLKAQLGGDRPNSVGRALPGIRVRVTDPDTGAELPVDVQGRLEAIIPGVSEDWIKTNDLGKIDADSIIYVFGRLDGAINRGGFKVLPEVIADALRLHPSVRDAGVIGIPDPRLGEVPLAAVELVRGAEPVTGEDLRAFTRQHLPSPSVPVDVRIFDELPRNGMLKINLPALRAMCDAAAAK